jgi:hypothetical protein
MKIGDAMVKGKAATAYHQPPRVIRGLMGKGKAGPAWLSFVAQLLS